jgi:hypothetical protein
MTYFDARALPKAQKEYVCWLDVMGMEAQMKRSIQVAANFVFKLHVAALEAQSANVSLYPVMDGFYACAKSRAEMEAFLCPVLDALCKLFMEQDVPAFRFIIRGAVAYGDVYHGRDVGDSGAKRLTENPHYRASIMLGPSVVDAHRTEGEAPPFGIAVHTSARASPVTGEAPYNTEWWRWWPPQFDREAFMGRLERHYDWCRQHGELIGYAPARIAVHEALATRYFLH